MPLPCSPVSNSTASEASEQSFPTSEDSDSSLTTTPRPGSSDPSQRTTGILSTPFVPLFSTSPAIGVRDTSTWSTPFPNASPERKHQIAGHTADSISLSPSKASDSRASTESQERKRSVTFLPHTASPKPSRESSYVSHSMMTVGESPGRSPHNALRNRMSTGVDEVAAESSADENTAIMRKSNSNNKLSYGAATANGSGVQHDRLMVSECPSDVTQPRKPGSLLSKRLNRNANLSAQAQDQAQKDADEEHEGWLRSLIDKYGSVELENKGSVARDHLALERTFLAWLRTSLSFASIGIAVTQLFRLNTTIASSNPDMAITFSPSSKLRSVGKPLGATFLGISILILLLGFHRYFESQYYVIRGKFPASRGTIILVSAVAITLIVASLVVVVAIAPQAFEKR